MPSPAPDPAAPEPAETDVTSLLKAVRDGSAGADEALLGVVYAELRRMADGQMRAERGQQTLQATALVHEAWLRLRGGADGFADRRHFFGAAARVMRQILVERYRRTQQRRRGADLRLEPDLDELQLAAEPEIAALDLVALDEALDALEVYDSRMAQIVQLRFFAGLSVEDTAAAMELSTRTVKREWAVARAWLFRRMS
ncbi:MAG: sigma-70 family RNA polymerase sigma factor [Planctomycetes bacterium]|nr:sigma-70 family RNA polymerase sigma factor [Planctomycetota bacterium]